METNPTPMNFEGEEMIIDHARPIRPCRSCGTTHRRVENCPPRTVNAVRQSGEQSPIKCFHRQKIGHRYRECWSLNGNHPNRSSGNQGTNYTNGRTGNQANNDYQNRSNNVNEGNNSYRNRFKLKMNLMNINTICIVHVCNSWRMKGIS